jgi:LPXTG-motif cell wall-anchored protein
MGTLNVGALGASVSAAGAGTTALAMTGFNAFWFTVTGVALVSAGMLLMRLRPKREF